MPCSWHQRQVCWQKKSASTGGQVVTRQLRTTGLIVIAAVLFIAAPSHAQTFEQFGTAVQDYFLNWFPRVTEIQSQQPHWITPLVTVTPRLEEELRYDQSFQSMQHGETTTNFGSGKGLELIPWYNTEVILGIPNYEAHEYPGAAGVKNRGT